MHHVLLLYDIIRHLWLNTNIQVSSFYWSIYTSIYRSYMHSFIQYLPFAWKILGKVTPIGHIHKTYTARFSLHQVYGSHCMILQEVLLKDTGWCSVHGKWGTTHGPYCHVLLLIPLSGLGCAMEADSDNVPSIVPYSGFLVPSQLRKGEVLW